jgi:simple sugar transport system permease protein
MSTPAVHKEPVLRIAKRDGLPHWKGWLIRVAAVVLA